MVAGASASADRAVLAATRPPEARRETHPAGPVARAWEEGGEAGADLISIAQVVKRGRVWKKKKVLGGNSAEV